MMADVGAGNGSDAEWLAERVTSGSVTATDVDTRHLRTEIARMTPLVHSVATDEFPPGSFDLVRIRMVLMRLPRPQDVVRKIARWLRPGGYLVIGGLDISVGVSSPEPRLAARWPGWSIIFSGRPGPAHRAAGTRIASQHRGGGRPCRLLSSRLWRRAAGTDVPLGISGRNTLGRPRRRILHGSGLPRRTTMDGRARLYGDLRGKNDHLLQAAAEDP